MAERGGEVDRLGGRAWRACKVVCVTSASCSADLLVPGFRVARPRKASLVLVTIAQENGQIFFPTRSYALFSLDVCGVARIMANLGKGPA